MLIANIMMLLLVGILIGMVIRNPFWIVFTKILSKAKLIPDYWSFVLLFSLGVVIVIPVTFNVSLSQNLDRNLTLEYFLFGTLFAIFVGNYAFVQVMENKVDKYREKGHISLKNGLYKRAKQYYEAAHRINPKEHQVLSDLLEIYLINKDYLTFDKKICFFYKEVIVEDNEKIIYFYLSATRYLLSQELEKATENIQGLINYIKSKPSSLEGFSWDFNDLTSSDTYKQLKVNSEAKRILDNLMLYLKKALEENRKKEFEEGDYSLSGNTP